MFFTMKVQNKRADSSNQHMLNPRTKKLFKDHGLKIGHQKLLGQNFWIGWSKNAWESSDLLLVQWKDFPAQPRPLLMFVDNWKGHLSPDWVQMLWSKNICRLQFLTKIKTLAFASCSKTP